jgi:integrase
MHLTQTPKTSTAARIGPGTPNDRAWFLIDSDWDAIVWRFKPTNVLEEQRPVQLHWDFALPGGRCLTDGRFAGLLQSSRELIAIIRCQSLTSGLPQRAKTVEGYFYYLRGLLRWMIQAGLTRFSDLDETALLQFQQSLAARPGIGRASLASTTVQKYLYLFTYLFRFRSELSDGLQFDPFPGRSHGEIAGVRDAEIRRWPHTPDAVAVALMQGAADLVSTESVWILRARQVCADAMASAMQRARSKEVWRKAANRALQQASVGQCSCKHPMRTVKDLTRMIEMLYAACFAVISYLVGPRLSEILHLCAGCVQRRDDDTSIAVISGAIYKKQPEYHGRPHEWVAPPLALQAICVLEALSAGHRARTNRRELWLRRRGRSGATEWRTECPGTLQVVGKERMRQLLCRFGAWLGLPDHEGKRWRLSTHQGRKTFARFCALRDRSGLLAMAQQFGHRERAVTDHGYAGSDYRLNQEIDAEILDQSVAAWEHMLSAPGLGGRAGAEIMTKRPRFRGARQKGELKRYARLLVDAGLVLGVCDWGFCIYREEYSACLGNARGPNPARREPSTCANCKNFAVSAQHRPYWIHQLGRHEALLDEPALPRQTLQIARERVDEARRLIRAIDARTSSEGAHGGTHEP